jgi:hypothetical protein
VEELEAWCGECLISEIESIRENTEIMREALEQIASKSGPRFGWDLKQIARAALAGEKEEKP